MTCALDFERAQSGGGIGGEVGIRSAGREDDDASFFEMPHGAPADVRLGHLMHLDGAHHARVLAHLLKRVLQRERIDDGGEHAHVVAGHAIHVLAASAMPRKMLPPPTTTPTSMPSWRMAAISAASAFNAVRIDARKMPARPSPRRSV